MEASNTSINAVTDLKITELIGNWFLYSVSLFVELSITLLSLVVMYHVIRSMLITKGITKPNNPINVYKWVIINLSATLVFRASMDAINMLVWDEVSLSTLKFLLNVDRIFNGLAMIPFAMFIYLLLRAGPVLEFQLLRMPLPTNLYPNWRTVRKPVLSLITVLAMSVIVTLAKLA